MTTHQAQITVREDGSVVIELDGHHQPSRIPFTTTVVRHVIDRKLGEDYTWEGVVQYSVLDGGEFRAREELAWLRANKSNGGTTEYRLLRMTIVTTTTREVIG